MKKCPYCGVEYPDNVELCPADLHRLNTIGATATPHPLFLQPDPTAEHRFWEHMTFRQFGVLIVRLQAVWLIFYAVVDATYIPPYLVRITSIFSMPHFYPPSLSSFLAVFRVILHIIAAILCIAYAEQILSWLVKDLVPKQPVATPPAPAPGASKPQ
jgi:hypothetical protein